MIIRRLDSFKEDFKRLPRDIQKRTEKQLRFLIQSISHPSLRIKKIEGSRNIWEARITKGYRFTLQMVGEIIILRRIGKHDETLKYP